MAILSDEFVAVLREMVRDWRQSKSSTGAAPWESVLNQRPIMTVEITEAPGTGTGTGSGTGTGTGDDNEDLWVGRIVHNTYGDEWEEYATVYVKPPNDGDGYDIGERYPASPARSVDGTLVVIAYPRGDEDGGGESSGIRLENLFGAFPPMDGIHTLRFADSDNLIYAAPSVDDGVAIIVTVPRITLTDGTNSAFLSLFTLEAASGFVVSASSPHVTLASATTTQKGIVDLGTQRWAGVKKVESLFEIYDPAYAGVQRSIHYCDDAAAGPIYQVSLINSSNNGRGIFLLSDRTADGSVRFIITDSSRGGLSETVFVGYSIIRGSSTYDGIDHTDDEGNMFVGGILVEAGSGTGSGTGTGGGGGGTVTSFSAGNLSPIFTTNVATATTTPALTFALSTQSANRVFAGPTAGGAAAPTFRVLVAADIPTHNHDASEITTGTLPMNRGGTGVALSDPGGHRLMGWDDTDNAIKFLLLGSGLAYDAATDTVSATGTASPWSGCRLSKSSTDPNPAPDAWGSATTYTNVHLVPFRSKFMLLNDGTNDVLYTVTGSEGNPTLTGTGTMNYIYAWYTGGAFTWHVSTTAPTLTSGRPHKTGDTKYLYLGAVYVNSGGTHYSYAVGNRGLANYHNPMPFCDKSIDTTSSWTNAGNGAYTRVDTATLLSPHPWTHYSVAPFDNWPLHAQTSIHATLGYSHAVAFYSTSTYTAADSDLVSAAAGTSFDVTTKAHGYRLCGIGRTDVNGIQTTFNATVRTAYGNGATVLQQSTFTSWGYC